MIFTTPTFFFFLAVVFALFWSLKNFGRQNYLLLAAGYIFYGWWDYRFCSLMLLSSVADFTFGRLLTRFTEPSSRRLVLVASFAFNLTLLGFFKYYNFFAQSLNRVFDVLGWQVDLATIQVILPVGISFYTFQSLSYIFDVYRREIEPTRSLRDYMAYVSFFPQLLAGPIERGRNLLPQISGPRHFDYAQAVGGLRLILWGFFKKVALADNLAACVDQAYAHPAAFDGAHLALATVCFAFQIYGDFSGYSDIAIGTASLFGIRLMRNFAYPYFSQSVAEFWRRWHISLSSWFRDYLYVPLGGSRVSRPRRVVNIMITFIVSGLWHGAAWTYVAWGALNGAGILTSVWRKKPRVTPQTIPGGAGWLPNPTAALGMALTFAFICVSWIFFRAHSFPDAFLILRRIFAGPFAWKGSEGFDTFLSSKGTVLFICVFVAAEWAGRQRLHPLGLELLPKAARWSVYTLVIWAALYLRPLHTGKFIYFQF